MGRTAAGAVTSWFAAAQAVADAILYEGYLLYPYRRSSGKNRVRWQFGVLLPPAWAQARGLTDAGVAGSAESWWQQTECLVQAPGDATVHLRVRFLQMQQRTVEERQRDGSYRSADTLRAGSRVEMGFDEAVPREFDIEVSLRELRTSTQRLDLKVPGGEAAEPLTDDRGHLLGRVVRRRWPVMAGVAISAGRCETPRLVRLRVRIENTGRAIPAESPRERALQGSLIACHCLLAVHGGEFISLLDPPEWAAAAARACSNVHTFPVLAGEPGSGDLVLSSPILLYDHPQVAPESPGDLHDAAEIDEILSLRTLTLTEAEKQEARATDPRAAAIVDRADAMPPEVLARLHGALRSPGTISGGDQAPQPPLPWWEPGADSSVPPGTDGVMVAGEWVAKGSRVRLRPRRQGTDPQDVFLDGKTAQVEAVLVDVDGSHQLAVTIEDDPGADLNRWQGRFRYFSPDEVEPVTEGSGPG
ncbi:MAG TPA: hypothetical protein VE733_27450 [Streptosporangiaceae bacterium]|jgi:hypothetical protein|nr:hypothetical protein [Streptosporangiaceae bacterium]